MHIKFFSDKKKFCWTHTEQHFALGSMPQDQFFRKFLSLFEKAVGRGKCIVAGHTPNSLGINIYIERASHNNIGCLGVSKNFWRKKDIFFGPRFFSLFHPKFSCGRTRIFFQKKKWKFDWKNSMFFSVWSTLMPASFRIVLWVAHISFQKSVKSKMLRYNFWSPRKNLSNLINYY